LNPFFRSAAYIERILEAEKPANLPVQAPTKFELVANLKAAKAIIDWLDSPFACTPAQPSLRLVSPPKTSKNCIARQRRHIKTFRPSPYPNGSSIGS
jgi:hypothetical protein